jgi:acyl carrier protein
MTETTTNRVCALIAQQFALKDVPLNSRLGEDFVADSLEVVELVLRLEEEFGISIPEDAARAAHTVSGLISLVEEKISQKGSLVVACEGESL